MRRLLVLIDFSDVTAELAQIAGDIASVSGAQVMLLHVAGCDAELRGPAPRQDAARLAFARDLREKRARLRRLGRDLEARGTHAVPMIVRGRSNRASPLEDISERARRLAPDLIVVGSQRRGILHRLLVGSVSAAIVRAARCPVLVVPSPQPGEPHPSGAALHTCTDFDAAFSRSPLGFF